MAVWLGWNYTPLCWSQLLCHFLRGPRVILPRPGWFIEWLHSNIYMVEGPMAQITHGYYALKACPLQCNKRCYCTHEWLPLMLYVCFLYPFLKLSNTHIWALLGRVKYPINISPLSCFQFVHKGQHISLSLSTPEAYTAFIHSHYL